MVIATIILLFFVLIFMIRYTNSKYSVAFLWLLGGITCIMMANAFYVTRLETYRTVFVVEIKIYDILKNIRGVRAFNNKYLVIAGVIMSCITLWHISLSVISRFKKYLSLVMMIAGSVILVLINSPDFCEKLYILKHTNEDFEINYNIICASIVIYNAIYVFMPTLAAVYEYIKEALNSRINVRRYRLLLMAVCIALTELCFIYLLVGTPISIYINPANVNNFILRGVYKNSQYLLYAPIVFVCVVIYFILGRMSIFTKLNIWDKIVLNRKERMLVTDMRHLFHSYKNSMFTILSLQTQALEHYGEEAGRESLKKIETTVFSFTARAQMLLKIFNDRQLYKSSNNICECVAEAIRSIALPPDVKINLSCESEEMYVWCDRESIIEMMVNMLNNSVDAIIAKESKSGIIYINIFNEYDMICIEIKDDGIGMTKNEMKNIFKPLISTKRTHKNWGIGLSYALKVVHSHKGNITVKSKKGEFTAFQITMISDKG